MCLVLLITPKPEKKQIEGDKLELQISGCRPRPRGSKWNFPHSLRTFPQSASETKDLYLNLQNKGPRPPTQHGKRGGSTPPKITQVSFFCWVWGCVCVCVCVFSFSFSLSTRHRTAKSKKYSPGQKIFLKVYVRINVITMSLDQRQQIGEVILWDERGFCSFNERTCIGKKSAFANPFSFFSFNSLCFWAQSTKLPKSKSKEPNFIWYSSLAKYTSFRDVPLRTLPKTSSMQMKGSGYF